MIGEAFQFLIDGFATCLIPGSFIFIIGAVFIGLLTGLLPGISGMTALAILIPLLYTMNFEGTTAFLVIIALSFVSLNGGAVTSILFSIPGTDCSVATILDGYPLTKKGRPGYAIGGALMGSLLGACIGCFMTIFLIVIIRPIILSFTSSEFFALVFAGLVMICVLIDSKQIAKGLIAAGLGILVSFIGYDPFASMPRLTFGSSYLYDGLTIIIVCTGLFALPEFMSMLIQEKKGLKPKVASYGKEYWKDMKAGFKDTVKKPRVIIQSGLIGGFIGIIPGVGATLSTFLSYGVAKSSSKHPDEFGKGSLEGVIAPETANNATQGGALLPLFAFGIPGNAVGALMLSALLMYGLTPGTKLMTTNLNVVYILIACGVLANVLATIILVPLSKYVTKLANMRTGLIFGPLFVILCFSCYVTRNNIMDIFAMVIVAVIGVALSKNGYPRSVFLIAFVLGPLLEENLFLAINTRGALFFVQRPICLAILIIALLVVIIPPLFRKWKANRTAKKASL